MKIVYQCFGGTHSSVIAAAMHLGLLCRDRVAGVQEIVAVSRFDTATPDDMGVPYEMGTDEHGNTVYVLGVGKLEQVATQIVAGLMRVLGMEESELRFVQTLDSIGALTRIGGFISRRLGLTVVGRPLVVAGIRRDYSKLAALVERVLSSPH